MHRYIVYSVSGRPILAALAFPRAARVAALGRYKGFTLRRWLYKSALRLAMAFRVDGLAGRMESGPLPDHPQFDFEAWLEQARCDLGASQIVPAVGFPSMPGSARFHVHLLSRAYRPLGFAKVSLDEANDRKLIHEGRTLRNLQTLGTSAFRFPEVLAEGEFSAHRYLITEPLPAGWRAAPAKWGDVARRCRDELASLGRGRCRLEDLSWWPRFRQNSGEVASLANALAAIKDELVEVAWAHGDFTNWNMCRQGKEVWIFDWENSSTDAPMLADEVRFFIGTKTRRLKSDPRGVAAAVGRKFLAARGEAAKKELALAVAFLSAAENTTGLIVGRHWERVIDWECSQ